MASTPRTGDYYQAALGVESTYGTFATPTIYLPYAKYTDKETIKDEPIKAHIGRRSNRWKVTRNSADPKQDLEMAAWCGNGLEHILMGTLGGGTDATALTTPTYLAGAVGGTGGGNQFIFSDSIATLPSFSLLKWANISSQPDPQAFSGAMINELKLTSKGPGIVDMTASFLSNTVDLSQSEPTEPVSYAPTTAFQFNMMQVLIDGGSWSTVTSGVPTYTTSFDLDIKNNIQAEHVADTKLGPSLKTPGALEITGNLEFAYQDWNELKNYLSGSTSGTGVTNLIKDRTLEIKFTGATIGTGTAPFLLDILMTRVNMTDVVIDDSVTKSVKYAFPFTALVDVAPTQTVQTVGTPGTGPFNPRTIQIGVNTSLTAV